MVRQHRGRRAEERLERLDPHADLARADRVGGDRLVLERVDVEVLGGAAVADLQQGVRLQRAGGLGHDPLTLVYVLENLGYGCRDTGLLFAAATQVVSAAVPLQKFGSDDLKERYLSRLIDGEIISAHAISEPDAGSDATAMATTATEDSDAYVLNGKKIWITSGPLADIITVYAKTGAEIAAASITAFLVPTDTPGFHVGEPIEKLGEIEYTYERKGGAVDKRVAFWLFEYRSGELAPDHEIADARWISLEEAARSLTYEGEREMARRALSRYVRDR